MKKSILLVLILFVAVPMSAQAFRLYFTPATQYTDNTAITAPNLPVMTDVWVDGQVLAVGATSSPVNISDNTFGATHEYTLQTRLNDGRKSGNLVVTLSNPLDQRLPKGPAAGSPSIGN